MDEETLKSYLPAYGDRVTVVAFCKTKTEGSANVNPRFEGALRELRASWKKGGTSRSGCFKVGNTSAKKTTRRIELGWMNYCCTAKTYKQVKQRCGGGVRHLTVEKSLLPDALLTYAVETFFPGGQSKRGAVEEFHTELRDFQGCCMDLQKTINALYEESKLKILRFYLYTNEKSTDEKVSTSDKIESDPESDLELGTPTILTNRRKYTEICSGAWIEDVQPEVPRRRRLLSLDRQRAERQTPATATFTAVESDYNCSSVQPSDESKMETNHPKKLEVPRDSTPEREETHWEKASVRVDTMSRGASSVVAVPEKASFESMSVEADTASKEAPSKLTSSMFGEVPNELKSGRTDVVTEEVPPEQRLSTADIVIEDDLSEEEEDFQVAIQESLNSYKKSIEEGCSLKEWIEKTLIKAEPQTMVIQRERILQTTLRIVSKPSFDWSHPLRVVFSGEDGEDLGGPKREFLWLLSKSIATAILCGPEGNMLFSHDGEKIERKMYETCGKLTAYNILNGGPGLPVINAMLFSLMTDRNIKPEVDIHTLSPTEDIACIKEILESCGEEEFKSVINKQSDWIIDQGLVPFNVKFENKEKVVTYLLKNNLYYRHHVEISQFLSGLNTVGSLHQELLRDPDSFASLFVRQTVNFTFDKFRTLYKINYSPEGSNYRAMEKDTVYCFEAFLMECTDEGSDVSLSDLLMFWTGADSVPPLGFDKVLDVEFVTSEGKKLPVAHTCGMVLELVRGISDPDLFREDMLKAIKWSGGFHLC